MEIHSFSPILSHPYDLLILVHPDIRIIEACTEYVINKGYYSINISRELSNALLSESMQNRSRFAINWLLSRVTQDNKTPILCTVPDLLFEPSLLIDPFMLFRQAARIHQFIVTWLGDYQSNLLSYAIPEHAHYRTWKMSDDLLHNPKTLIQRIETN